MSLGRYFNKPQEKQNEVGRSQGYDLNTVKKRCSAFIDKLLPTGAGEKRARKKVHGKETDADTSIELDTNRNPKTSANDGKEHATGLFYTSGYRENSEIKSREYASKPKGSGGSDDKQAAINRHMVTQQLKVHETKYERVMRFVVNQQRYVIYDARKFMEQVETQRIQGQERENMLERGGEEWFFGEKESESRENESSYETANTTETAPLMVGGMLLDRDFAYETASTLYDLSLNYKSERGAGRMLRIANEISSYSSHSGNNTNSFNAVVNHGNWGSGSAGGGVENGNIHGNYYENGINTGASGFLASDGLSNFNGFILGNTLLTKNDNTVAKDKGENEEEKIGGREGYKGGAIHKNYDSQEDEDEDLQPLMTLKKKNPMSMEQKKESTYSQNRLFHFNEIQLRSTDRFIGLGKDNNTAETKNWNEKRPENRFNESSKDNNDSVNYNGILDEYYLSNEEFHLDKKSERGTGIDDDDETPLNRIREKKILRNNIYSYSGDSGKINASQGGLEMGVGLHRQSQQYTAEAVHAFSTLACNTTNQFNKSHIYDSNNGNNECGDRKKNSRFSSGVIMPLTKPYSVLDYNQHKRLTSKDSLLLLQQRIDAKTKSQNMMQNLQKQKHNDVELVNKKRFMFNDYKCVEIA
ncbi:hypothetical protein AX774_g7085 [Zancudomyces culisetae]|uniref:Uncharacterized protein n=1 Tax=Zancudomyces culisetae TaxID=1213189 RepID=A0A1R1PEX4_ZANCU|nr:hypothetical protein AX774_g7085 [Zancudomyces culisetae]|eukprot:OMH79506.1 hypothetical protein AX774_g7085 [Zancudomyces culisetae]